MSEMRDDEVGLPGATWCERIITGIDDRGRVAMLLLKDRQQWAQDFIRDVDQRQPHTGRLGSGGDAAVGDDDSQQ